MLEAYIRSHFEFFLIQPVLKIISSFRPSPNYITIAAGISGVLLIPAVIWGSHIIVILLLLISGYLDALDGAVARRQQQQSVYGAAIDVFTDRVVEVAVIIALYLQAPTVRSLACIGMLGAILLCVTSFLLAAIAVEETNIKSFYYSPGLMERLEAFGFFIVMFIWPQTFLVLAWTFTILVGYTAVRRLYEIKFYTLTLNTG